MIANIPDCMVTPDSPMFFALTDYGDTGMHTHSFVEVFYIISGQIDHRFLGGQTTRLVAGDMAIIPEGCAHSFFRSEDTECVHRDIEIASGFWKAVCDFVDLSLNFKSPRIIHLSTDTVRRFEQNIRRISQLMPTASPNRASLTTTLAVAITEQAVLADTESMFDSMPIWFRRLLDRFNSPDGMKQGLEYILSQVDYDRKYLCRVFKKRMGVTMTEYLNHMRITCAYNMLQSDDDNIIDIAHKVGFSSVSYFNICFKNQFGITPGQLRTGHIKP